jgi:anti-sigma factor RsiW
VGFHFGVLDATARATVEQHLVTCPACLGEFLSVKRDVELSALTPERPRASARMALRRAVAQELGLVAAPTVQPWWQRPLAFGLAAAAVLVAMVTVQAVATSAPTAPVGVQRGR